MKSDQRLFAPAATSADVSSEAIRGAATRPVIVRADAMGMCFGVRDALAAIEELPDPGRVAVHGELVHNEVVAHRLDARGIVQSSEGDRDGRQLPDRSTLVVTAHGISEAERRRLLEAGKDLVDTTCPLVAKAHRAAHELASEGRFVVVVGKPGHVEVRGLVGDLERYAIVRGPDEVETYPVGSIGVVCQTTTADDVVESTVAAVRDANPGADVRFIDTVCEPTRARQRALQRLIDACDRVVVVGGTNSNNTAQLARRCREAGVEAVHVQGPEGLEVDWLRAGRRIGLTAGTSTLAETIDAVEARMVEILGG